CQPTEQFMYQGGRLQRMSCPFTLKGPTRPLAQFLIDQWRQLLKGKRISRPPLVQQHRDRLGRRGASVGLAVFHQRSDVLWAKEEVQSMLIQPAGQNTAWGSRAYGGPSQ